MKVKELINKLMECPLSEEVYIAINEVHAEDKIVYVGSKDLITIRTPQQIGDTGVWIESEITERLNRRSQGSSVK